MRLSVWTAALAVLAIPGIGRAGCELKKYGDAPVSMEGLRPILTVKVNGADHRFLADTGAFFSLMSREGARSLGLFIGPPPEGLEVLGLGGSVEVGVATAKSVEIAGVPLRNVQFIVGGAPLVRGTVGVIGQNLLGQTDVEFDLGQGVMRFFEAQGCGSAPLAYWAKGGVSTLTILSTDPIEPHYTATATLNGAPVRVIFDTGAPVSYMGLQAAARAGVTPQGEGVIPAGAVGGVGRKTSDSWVGRFDSFKLGDEEIRHAKLRIGGLGVLDADMLLGADFFLSHRIYVSSRQNKLYFTYNGGRVFDLEAAPPASGADQAANHPAESEPLADADAYRRRAAAFASRNDLAQAIADYGHAAELAPTDPLAFRERAMLELRTHKDANARRDLDHALALKPGDALALYARGALRMEGDDKAGGRADLEAALSAAPGDDALPLHVANGYAMGGDYARATALIDRWLASHADAPNRVGALNSSCWYRGLLNRELERARADCDQALKLAPKSPRYLDSRGLVRLRQGDLDGAIADYDEALKRDPKLAWSLYGRGIARLEKGAAAEGKADLAAAVALDPTLPDKARNAGLAP